MGTFDKQCGTDIIPLVEGCRLKTHLFPIPPTKFEGEDNFYFESLPSGIPNNQVSVNTYQPSLYL